MWLQNVKPTTETLPLIIGAMGETFDFRRQFIDFERPSISEIMSEYPRFLDIGNGRLVSNMVIDG